MYIYKYQFEQLYNIIEKCALKNLGDTYRSIDI